MDNIILVEKVWGDRNHGRLVVGVGVDRASAAQALGEYILESGEGYDGATYELVPTKLYGWDALEREIILANR